MYYTVRIMKASIRVLGHYTVIIMLRVICVATDIVHLAVSSNV